MPLISMRASVAVHAMVAVLALSARPANAPLKPAVPGSLELPCRQGLKGSWRIVGSRDRIATLDDWCQSVGPPAVRHVTREERSVRRIAIVSWNVHVGGGDIAGLVGPLLALGPDVGVVVLLQEAFRAGAAPTTYPHISVPSRIAPRRPVPDVVEVAGRLGMSVVYIPSMRNGASSLEDRGNAVLSTERLDAIEPIELPFGRQRRVAIACTVRPLGSAATAFRVVSMHFDTSRDRRAQAEALLTALPDPAEPHFVLAGGDLNALRGRHDGAFHALKNRFAEKPCGDKRSNTWPARLDVPFGWWRGRIDFIFSNEARQNEIRLDTCETLPGVYGSDHHPLLLWLHF